MCGIFALLNQQNISYNEIENEFMKGQSRGPEFSKLEFNYIFTKPSRFLKFYHRNKLLTNCHFN